MRQGGLWHPSLVELIVSMRHYDTIVIADAGLPVPANVPTIELGWQRREPRLLPVLSAVLGELVVEQATIANEVADPELLEGLQKQLRGLPIVRTPHDALKASCGDARAVIRTGEDTPFANVILHAGVPFPSVPASHLSNGHEATQGRLAP
ncbi:MAG: D-ribose pyranase [Acidothermaceae bacterium]